MAERTLLDDAQAREIEEQLFYTLRQQTNRHVPMPLPRKDFWERIALLLDTIEMKVHEIYRTRGPDLRLQNLQKRQANIRRTASDLARKRLVAMLQHAHDKDIGVVPPLPQRRVRENETNFSFCPLIGAVGWTGKT